MIQKTYQKLELFTPKPCRHSTTSKTNDGQVPQLPLRDGKLVQ